MPIFGRGMPGRRDDGRAARDQDRQRKLAEGDRIARTERDRQEELRLERNRLEERDRLEDMHRDGRRDGRY